MNESVRIPRSSLMADATSASIVLDGARRGPVSELLSLLGVSPPADMAADGQVLCSRQLRAGEVLFQEGDPLEAIYFVTRGAFKIYRTAEDGYEQVLGFVGRAELLAFDGLCMMRCSNAAQALEEASVMALGLAEVQALQQRLPVFASALQRAVSLQLQRRGDIVELMAAVAAEVRLARFLVQMSERQQAGGQTGRKLRLRMCRRDIASYLGLAHETISRSFSALVEWGYLQVNNREVDLLDPEGLKALARNTRGFADQLARHAQAANDRPLRPLAARKPMAPRSALARGADA